MVFPSGGWLSHGAPSPQGTLFFDMQKNTLSKTNPYLKDAAQRKALLYTSVATSTAIEGVIMSAAKSKKPSKKTRKPMLVHESRSSYGSRR
jgi:hypothetical protein